MTSQLKNPINLYQGMLVVGLCLATYSIVANVMLYSTFATTQIDTIMMQVLAVCFDAGKFLLLPAALMLWLSKHPILSFAATISWVVLTGLSMTAGFGYLANIQNDKEQQLKTGSNLYSMALEDRRLSANNVADLSRFSSIDSGTLEAKNIELLGLIQANESHRYFNHRNPSNFSRMQGENARYRAQIAANNSKIRGFGDYQAAKTSQAQANQEWRNVNVGGGITESMPAIWRYLAMVLPYDASTIRSGFISISSMGAEIFATLFLLIFSTHQKRGRGVNLNELTIADYHAMKSQFQEHNESLGWFEPEVVPVPTPSQPEPVPVEQARVKGGVYSCSTCGTDYTARHKNHLRCTDCSTEARTKYAKGERT